MFQNAVTLVFGTLGPKVPEDFVEDRSQMRGAKFDLDKMRAAIPQMRDQMRAQLGWIEAQLSDGRKWLFGEFSLADVSAYMNVWYVRSNLTAEEDRAIAGLDKILAGLTQVAAWENRVRAIGHGLREEMSADEALGIAAKASPETVAENDPDDPNGRKVGDTVRVVPDDYGRVKLAERSFLSRRSTSPYAASTNGSARSWSISRARVFSFSRAEGLSVLPGRSGAAKGA